MHASYVTKILPWTKFENQLVRHSLTNSLTPKKVAALYKESQNGAPVPKNKRFAELTEAERNRLLVETQAKSTKSSTNWAVNAFKGMNLRKHDYNPIHISDTKT